MTNIKELGEKIVKVITQCKHKECNGCTYFRKEIDSILKSYIAEVIGEDEGYDPRTASTIYHRNDLHAEQRIRAGITDTQGKEDKEK